MIFKKAPIFTVAILVLSFAMISCQSDDPAQTINLDTSVKLSEVMANRTVETGAVIACAASDVSNAAVVHIYYYLEEGATNVQFFETNSTDVDPNDYSKYSRLDITSEPLFDGFIEQFTRPFGSEQWIIVAFERQGELKLSNPIRTKNSTQATIWTDEISINQQISSMPQFEWQHNVNGGNAIYFQVLSTLDNGLLSGTYTHENQFQYYNTSNVVLNITPQNPLNLTVGNSYRFLVMDVSEDNWVNTVFQTIFITE